MIELEELLNTVSLLQQEYESKRDFNVFYAIRFRNQEIMHSKFIGTLLNPKEQHKMGNVFLKLYLKQNGYADFDTNNIVVFIERDADRRRIDITVENNDTILIIENKIWAEDQPGQLEYYYNFCIEKIGKKVDLIYLTPYGQPPTNSSLGKLTRDKIKLISYEKHIIPWIFECSKVAAESRLKHSLKMYHEILQTVINRSQYMNKIFEELKTDKSKLKLAIDITSALYKRDYIKEFPEIKSLLKELVEKIIGEPNLNVYFEPSNNAPMEEVTSIAIEDVTDTETWCIHFYEQVYLSNNVDTSKDITLFDCTDYNDKLLQSLIIEDKEKAEEILVEKLSKIYKFI